MHLSGLDLFYWVAGLVGHLVLFSVLIWKRLFRQFPIFSSLIALYVARTLVLFVTYRHGSKTAYFNLYWTFAIVDVLLQIGIFFEVAAHVFRPAGTWTEDIRRSFFWIIPISTIVAIVITALAAPEAKTLKQVVVIRGDLLASVLVSELFIGGLTLSAVVRLAWNTRASRIAKGWGMYTLVGILIQGFESYFGVQRGMRWYLLLSRVQIGTYLCCLLYWILTFAKSDPEPQELPEQLRHHLLRLNHNMTALLSYVRREP